VNGHADDDITPRVFMSYSHDDEGHSTWVLDLARRLRSNGVDVCLDRWDVTLGGNLALFMERAANLDYRVVAVVSEPYALKADIRTGGVGAEAQMLSSSLYTQLDSDRVMPIIRNNPGSRLPAFLAGRLYQDFRDSDKQEEAYEALLRAIYGRPVDAAPPLGPNPFQQANDVDARLAVRNSPSRWHRSALRGHVDFTYSENSGVCTIGSEDCQFTLTVGYRNVAKVYVCRGGNTSHVAVVEGVPERSELLEDVAQFDTSNRLVGAEPGDAVILRNEHGYWALLTILDIDERRALNRERIIRFTYVINTDRTTDFRCG
jgi:hypothetical protein